MKSKRLISAVMVLVMLAALLPGAAFAATTPTQWAVSEMNDANTVGILTPSASRDFQRNLTRDEFCEIVVIMAERLLGKELPIPANNPFTDSSSAYVLKANAYGVVNGKTTTTFGPTLQVERQELVTMMIRAIRRLETDMGRSFLSAGVALPFKDNAKIGEYALEPMRLGYANGIIKGDDVGNCNPLASVTSQECVAMIIRCFNKIRDMLGQSKTNQQIVDMVYDTLELGYAYGDTANGVAQNITLATKGLGNTTITWQSSNSGAISSSGTVYGAGTGGTVTLTATITLGAATRTKTFTVRMSTYSGDRQLLENAYNELDIIYGNADDSADSVTGRICLPTSVLGLPVTWVTSNASVVQTNGVVSVPTGSDTYSVTLTATIKGTQTLTKTFTLRVQNPQYKSKGVSLSGVALGMTQAQVTSALGTAKRTISASSTETWLLFHTGYSNFIAVALIGGKVVEVYSMASNVANTLQDATSKSVLTVSQVNSMSGVKADSYSDPGASNAVYAIRIYDSTSAVAGYRTMTADGQEQLVFELMNAYRYRNNRSALTFNTKLGESTRAHSNDMSTYNYLSNTTRNSTNKHAERAAAKGYEKNLVSNGFVIGGGTGADAIVFFGVMIGDTTIRGDILSSTNTVVGLGFANGTSTSEHKTYLSYVFGTLVAITNVSSNPTSLTVSPGSSAQVTLNITPTNRNETYTITSSNTSIMTVSTTTGTTNTPTVTVTGVRAGSAEVTLTGVSSGITYTISVTVGAVYANSMSLSYQYGTQSSTLASGSTTNNNVTSNSQLLVEASASSTLRLIATPYNSSGTALTGTSVTWSGTNASASIDSSGNVRGIANGSATFTATVYTSASATIRLSVTVNVVTVGVITPASLNVTIGTPQTLTASFAAIAAQLPCAYAWSSSNAAATVTNTTAQPINSTSASLSTQVAGVSATTTPITVSLTISRTGCVNSIVKSVNVSVTGTQTLTVDEAGTTIYMIPGQTKTLGIKLNGTLSTTNVTCSVDNTNAADVSVSNAGVISANGASVGTSTITVKLSGGQDKTVTVVTAWPTITIDTTTVDVASSGQTGTIAYTINYGGAAQTLPSNYTFAWNSGTPGDATFTNPGSNVLTVTTANASISISVSMFYNNGQIAIATAQKDVATTITPSP